MGRLLRHRLVCLALLTFSLSAFGMTKTFPADRGSVAAENAAADAAGIPRYHDGVEMQSDIDSGVLVPIPITTSQKLPDSRKYIRRAAADFMVTLDEGFYRATHSYLIVDSAVRPADVQDRLCHHNKNAAPATGPRASSHERGTTFDISRKVFVRTNHDGTRNVRRMTRSEWRYLKTQLLYYRAIGRILVIEEKACIHIMVREDS